ncbi:HupE/UreJ family protein [Tepidamorphus sp. 3E244]|uniref:HupE/UreJ family protein n=1 Tax=Tepidamorphus sp. 3E244 TaxID=3385498 RepID=UPI0038FBE836
MITLRKSASLALGALAAVSSAVPAFAHHPLGGAPMTSFADGLLSGFGHPVLGFDHLFFVLAVGVAAMVAGRGLTAPFAYIAAMIAGVGLSASGLGLPMAEAAIVVSLLVVGGMLVTGKTLHMRMVLPAFAIFGLFHGTAFGGALAEQESVSAAVLAGYLVGLGAIQYAIALGAGFATAAFYKASDAGSVMPRMAGAAVAGVGTLLALEGIEGAAFTMLGLA